MFLELRTDLLEVIVACPQKIAGPLRGEQKNQKNYKKNYKKYHYYTNQKKKYTIQIKKKKIKKSS